MSVDGIAVDAERFVLKYLSPTYPDIAAEKTLEDPTRFVVVKRVTGGEDMIADHPIISIHCFDTSYTASKDLALDVHALMKALTPKTAVVVQGITYNVDYRCVEEYPHEVDYDDKTVRRFVARYGLGLRLK